MLRTGREHQRVSPCRIALLVKYLLVLSDLEQSNVLRLEEITLKTTAWQSYKVLARY